MNKRSKPFTGTVAALDIGSAKVVCFIARLEANGAFRVTGVGHQLSRGIRGGHIVDFVEAETSIVAAVHAAEQMAGETIEQVIVNVAGAGLQSRLVSAELNIHGRAVSEGELSAIKREAKRGIHQPDAETLHCFTTGYRLDEVKNILDPCGMSGQKLGADLHMVTAAMIRNIHNCLAHCHLNAAAFVASPYASGLSALERDEMELGVTLIDMGAGMTSAIVFNEEKPLFCDVAPIGGCHVTNDLAKGLSTSVTHAERLKTLHGSAIPTSSDEQAMIHVPQLGEEEADDQGNLMPRSMLVGIIRPRLEEIFEMIRSKLEIAGLDAHAGRRVVLTGGASQMLGVRELAVRILGKQVRLARPRLIPNLNETASGPAFSTAIGMLEYARTRPWEDKSLQPPTRSQPRFSFARLVDWMKENL
jgi:cell division protein FtsA